MDIAKSTKKVRLRTDLERKRKSVEQLQRKLESYLCEPQTYSCFEKREFLKSALKRVATKTDVLLAALKIHDIDQVEQEFEEFEELNLEVMKYLTQTQPRFSGGVGTTSDAIPAQ